MSPKDLGAPPQATHLGPDVWGQLDEIKFRTFGQLYSRTAARGGRLPENASTASLSYLSSSATRHRGRRSRRVAHHLRYIAMMKS